jgi:hypothetical protein
VVWRPPSYDERRTVSSGVHELAHQGADRRHWADVRWGRRRLHQRHHRLVDAKHPPRRGAPRNAGRPLRDGTSDGVALRNRYSGTAASLPSPEPAPRFRRSITCCTPARDRPTASATAPRLMPAAEASAMSWSRYSRACWTASAAAARQWPRMTSPSELRTFTLCRCQMAAGL